ncbi:MAG: I78 family peptidase inhibitor [Paracoccaceae bacterium]
MRLAFAAPLLLAACVSTPPPSGVSDSASPLPQSGTYPTGVENSCDGERFGQLVGRDATALERVLIMGQVRIIRPGMVVAQDFRPERINFEIGTDERIARITCG